MKKLSLLGLILTLSIWPTAAGAVGGSCAPGNTPAAGTHHGVVTPNSPDWYDASANEPRGYSVRGSSATRMAMVIYRWDRASDCRAISGAWSNSLEADFSLSPGDYLINIFADGASPGTYVLVGSEPSK